MIPFSTQSLPSPTFSPPNSLDILSLCPSQAGLSPQMFMLTRMLLGMWNQSCSDLSSDKTTVFPVVTSGYESWIIKKAERQRIDAFKLWCWRRLCKEMKQVNPKGNQPWIFTGRTDAEAPILWPPVVKNWFTGKDPDARKGWKQKEKQAA